MPAGDSEYHRRAKFYRLTRAGKSQFGIEAERWTKVAFAMANALEAT